MVSGTKNLYFFYYYSTVVKIQQWGVIRLLNYILERLTRTNP